MTARPLIVGKAKYFIAGVLESADAQLHSGAHEFELMDAYWAGHRFAFKLPRRFRRTALRVTSAIRRTATRKARR